MSEFAEFLSLIKEPEKRAKHLVSNLSLLTRGQFISLAEKLIKELKEVKHKEIRRQLEKMVAVWNAQLTKVG